jgi:hypothetical protein
MQKCGIFFQEEDKERYEAEMAIASVGKNWGFCSDECINVNEEFKYTPKFTGLGLMAYLDDQKCTELLGVRYNKI